MKKSSSRRRFLLGGVAALACLVGQAEATIPLTMVDNGLGIPGGPTFVGQAQSQTNQVTLSGMTATYGTPPQPGDLALFYGVVNTASTASGIQGIAAGPTGWTSLVGAGVSQISTTPTFTTRGIWWRVLTQADITADVVQFTTGTLATIAASGMMLWRGATTPTFTLRSSGSGSGTAVSQALPVKPAGLQLMIELMCTRADLAEVISPVNGFVNFGTYQHQYAGVMFAGTFYFCDPITYTGIASGTARWQWTTSSGVFNHNISIP